MKKEQAAIKRTLSRNLKECRRKLGLTQEKAAEKADISYNYWQRLEMVSQSDLPSLSALFKIAKGMGVNPGRLLKE